MLKESESLTMTPLSHKRYEVSAIYCAGATMGVSRLQPKTIIIDTWCVETELGKVVIETW